MLVLEGSGDLKHPKHWGGGMHVFLCGEDFKFLMWLSQDM